MGESSVTTGIAERSTRKDRFEHQGWQCSRAYRVPEAVDAYADPVMVGGSRRGSAVGPRARQMHRGRTPATGYEYARQQLERILDLDEHARPARLASDRMLFVLRSLLAEETLYPSMSIDEDGDVIAEWRVRDYGLQLIATGDSVAWTLRRNGVRLGTSASLPEFRTLLARLTEIVDKANPGWRTLFPEAPSHKQ